MPAAEDRKKLPEVKLLPAVGDVNDLVGIPLAEPVFERGEIGRRVVRRAVGFLHERGHRTPAILVPDEKRIVLGFRFIVGENAQRAFAFDRDGFFAKPLHHVLQPRVVKTFAERDIEPHAEPPVNGVELRLRKPDHLAPERKILRVTRLQFHQLRARGFKRPGIFLATRGNEFVDALHLAERIADERVPVQFGFPADEQHPELRAPVADVVVAHDIVAGECGDASDGVAQDRRADVADVHWLRDVRRREIDDDLFRVSGRGDAEFFVAGEQGEMLREPRWLEPEIDEPRARDLQRLADFGDIETVDDLLRELARIRPLLFREHHRDVGLVVAKPRIGRGRDGRIRHRAVTRDRLDCATQMRF